MNDTIVAVLNNNNSTTHNIPSQSGEDNKPATTAPVTITNSRGDMEIQIKMLEQQQEMMKNLAAEMRFVYCIILLF